VTGDGTNDAPALKAADVGLAMGITGTKVAQGASDIVILDDKFSSIVRAIMWGRSVYDNIRKFLQFQLTVNVVALLIVFIGAVADFTPPLNAVMMLWVNLVMDTLGALALATEMPTMKLLERKPYRRDASLISRPMMRNILAQSAFQLTMLLVLLTVGAKYFGIRDGEWCANYPVKSSSTKWNVVTLAKDPSGVVGCSDFKSACKHQDDVCLEHEFLASIYDVTAPADAKFAFEDLKGFEKTCLKECTIYDHTHRTIIFNTFIFAQIFNEYNAKSLGDEWDVFSSIPNNHIFLIVSFVTVCLQIMLVEVGGEFIQVSPLSGKQWLVTVALGSIALVVGIIMRFIPVTDDPATFFDNSKTGQSHKNSAIEIDTSAIKRDGEKSDLRTITPANNNSVAGSDKKSPLVMTDYQSGPVKG
jgi:magnesium-transporting ATPase (P-type)